MVRSRGNPSLGTSVSSTCLDVSQRNNAIEVSPDSPCFLNAIHHLVNNRSLRFEEHRLFLTSKGHTVRLNIQQTMLKYVALGRLAFDVLQGIPPLSINLPVRKGVNLALVLLSDHVANTGTGGGRPQIRSNNAYLARWSPSLAWPR